MTEINFLKELESLNVKIIDPSTTYIDSSCKIGENTIIYPNNFILGNTVIGKNNVIQESNHIENSVILNDNKIVDSYIVGSKIGSGNNIGPYSRLREAEILDNTKIGNFVEIKKSIVGDGVKISHLAYVGDAEIGENTNIGCGVIFCNYNGKDKFKTYIGKNVFIGSNSNLIAPVIIGDNTFIAAGCTIYKNIESDKFVIGTRNLVIKEDYKKIHIKKKWRINIKRKEI